MRYGCTTNRRQNRPLEYVKCEKAATAAFLFGRRHFLPAPSLDVNFGRRNAVVTKLPLCGPNTFCVGLVGTSLGS
jgi:hypothetical protein